jgi:mannose-1-phosphate guanylyltransferase
VGRDPLLVEQLKRLSAGGIATPARTLVLTNASLVKEVARLAPRIPRANIIAEPKPAGTAAALVWAAHVIADRDSPQATMISVHADWAIGDDTAFRETLRLAASAAETHRALVTVGIVPTRADPGLGYIEPGQQVSPNVRRVARFVEKPTREHAAEIWNVGYLWNSGIFAWRVGDFLEEVREHAPQLSRTLERHGSSLVKFFGAVRKPIAVDHAVLEHSRRMLVVDGSFGWDDVGTWGALRRVRPRDAQQNATSGAVYAYDSTNNVAHADDGGGRGGQQVVLYGVNDLVVVAKDGLTLVTTVDRSADLKKLVESLPAKFRKRT